MFGLQRCSLVGMVHLLPLPGSPGWAGSAAAIRARAEADLAALVEGGCDAVIVENMGDAPYLKRDVAPATLAAMAIAVDTIVRKSPVPVGVQVLAGANEAALGVAVASGASFLRVEGFAYAAVADEGWMDACAGPLLRSRSALGSQVEIWADIQKKHSAHAVTADLDLADLARGCAFCGADAVVVTGGCTGASTSPNDVMLASNGELPVIVGSGVTPADAGELARVADALIVGSWLKVDGDWRNEVDVERVRTLRGAMGPR